MVHVLSRCWLCNMYVLFSCLYMRYIFRHDIFICSAMVFTMLHVSPCCFIWPCSWHNGDVIMSAMTPQITSLTTVYSVGCRSKKTSQFHWPLWGLPTPVNSPHKGPVTRKLFPCDDIITTKSANNHCSVNSGLYLVLWVKPKPHLLNSNTKMMYAMSTIGNFACGSHGCILERFKGSAAISNK